MRSFRGLLTFVILVVPFFHSLAQDVLNEAIVTSSSTGLTVKDNIITYDISKDSLATSKSLGNLISSMPLVNYNQQERVLSVNGKNNVCILLDGRKSLVINTSNFYYIAELLKGKQLKSISINTAPDGQYYNYAAVIDIASKDILSNLFTGAASIRGTTNYSFSPDLGITAGNGRLISNVSYKYEWSHSRPTWNYTESRLDANTTSAFMAADTTIHSPSNLHDFKLALSYDITPNDVLFANGAFGFSDNRYKTVSVSAISGEDLFLSGENLRKDKDAKGSLAYQHFFDRYSQKMLTLQYSVENKYNDIYYSVKSEANRFSDFQQIVSADYFHTVDHTSNWFATLAWFSRKYGSVTNGTSILNHNQDVLRADVNYSKNIGKFRLSGQVAYDYTFDLANFNTGEQPYKDNYGLFRYQARINWFPAAGHSAMFIVSRDLHRAAIKFRNPYRDESVAGIVSQGNPLLPTEKIDNVFISYNYIKGARFSAGASMSLTHSSDGVFASTSVLDDGRLFHTYYAGEGRTDIRLGPNIMLRANEKFTLNANYLIIYDSFQTATDNPKLISHFLYLNSRWNVWKDGELFFLATLQDPTSIQSSSIVQMKRHHYIVSGGLSLTQRFRHALICTIGINEPWYHRVQSISETLVNGNDIYSINSRPGQIVYFYIQYNVGHFNSFVKRNTRRVIDQDINKQ